MADFLLAIAARIVPETGALDAAGRAESRRIMVEAIASRPPVLRSQLALFLFLLRWLPFLRYGLPLDRLSAQRQDRVLRWFQDAPLAIVRKGFWGVKTVIFMGYYGQPAVWGKIEYRPAKNGNERLHGR